MASRIREIIASLGSNGSMRPRCAATTSMSAAVKSVFEAKLVTGATGTALSRAPRVTALSGARAALLTPLPPIIAPRTSNAFCPAALTGLPSFHSSYEMASLPTFVQDSPTPGALSPPAPTSGARPCVIWVRSCARPCGSIMPRTLEIIGSAVFINCQLDLNSSTPRPTSPSKNFWGDMSSAGPGALG
ncbi:Uncharacterised protein [Mycobacteroides abscessus subsp. massiliense]|nr:Uncharacterised protein [Mycobacteroides abscessus subsp. massiliense]